MHTITIKSFPVHTQIEISVLSLFLFRFCFYYTDVTVLIILWPLVILIHRLQKCYVLLSTGWQCCFFSLSIAFCFLFVFCLPVYLPDIHQALAVPSLLHNTVNHNLEDSPLLSFSSFNESYRSKWAKWSIVGLIISTEQCNRVVKLFWTNLCHTDTRPSIFISQSWFLTDSVLLPFLNIYMLIDCLISYTYKAYSIILDRQNV